MHKLTYITDKRTPYQTCTSDMIKYQLNKHNKVSKNIDVPSNLDKQITIPRFVYGTHNINDKFKLLRFYLNNTTFKHFNDIELMTDIITLKFGVESFIRNTIILATCTPELFTINKAHYIMSYLLGIAFNLIEYPNAKKYYKCYASLLGYLNRNDISNTIYGVDKSILIVKPLEIKVCMSNKIKNMVHAINQEISKNPHKNYLDLFIKRQQIQNNNTIEYTILDEFIPENDDESESEPDETTPLLGKYNQNKYPESTHYTNYIDYSDSENDDNNYHYDYNIIKIDDVFGNINEQNKEYVKSIVDLIPFIRNKSEIHIGEYRLHRISNWTYINSIINDVPKVIIDLCIKYNEHLMMTGGYFTNIHTYNTCKSSDLDIFILKIDNEELDQQLQKDLINALEQLNEEDDIRISQNISALSIVSTKYITLQFIKTEHNRFTDVLNNFDIKNCQIGVLWNFNENIDDDFIYETVTVRDNDTTNYNTFSVIMSSELANNSNKLIINDKIIDYSKPHVKICLRVLKYLAKGLKLDINDDNMKLIKMLSQICRTQPTQILKLCEKHFRLDNNLEEENIEQQMNQIFGGTYLGNKFEEISIKPFVKSNGFYPNNYNINVNYPIDAYELLEMDNFDDIQLYVRRCTSVTLYKFANDYYITMEVPSNKIKKFITKCEKTNRISINITEEDEITDFVKRIDDAIFSKIFINNSPALCIVNENHKMKSSYTPEDNISSIFNNSYNPDRKYLTINLPHMVSVLSKGQYISLDEYEIDCNKNLIIRIKLQHYYINRHDSYGLKFMVDGTIVESQSENNNKITIIQ